MKPIRDSKVLLETLRVHTKIIYYTPMTYSAQGIYSGHMASLGRRLYGGPSFKMGEGPNWPNRDLVMSRANARVLSAPTTCL